MAYKLAFGLEELGFGVDFGAPNEDAGTVYAQARRNLAYENKALARAQEQNTREIAKTGAPAATLAPQGDTATVTASPQQNFAKGVGVVALLLVLAALLKGSS